MFSLSCASRLIKNGCTALIRAAFKGHISVVKKLIKAKAEVNIQSNFGCTALIRAASRGLISAVKKLIEAKAELN